MMMSMCFPLQDLIQLLVWNWDLVPVPPLNYSKEIDEPSSYNSYHDGTWKAGMKL
jgi:hypothetical protein